MEEYQTALSEFTSLTLDKRVAWEDAKGFKSFGRVCDEIYKNANPENFTHIEEFNVLVAKNSNYLYLEKLPNGELSLETVLSRSRDRYFLNKDKLFQIGTNVYKVLENDVVSTKIENIDNLKSINENNLISIRDDSNFSISGNNSSELNNPGKVLKDTQYNCGTAHDDYESSGNDRTELWINCGRDFSNGTVTAWAWYSVRAKKRGSFFLPWVLVKRHISVDLKTRVDYQVFNTTLTWRTANIPAHENDVFVDILEKTIYATAVNGIGNGYSYHFGGYDCWGDTPSSPTVNLECNISIL